MDLVVGASPSVYKEILLFQLFVEITTAIFCNVQPSREVLFGFVDYLPRPPYFILHCAVEFSNRSSPP